MALRLYDVAPSILACFGIRQKDLPGKPLTQLHSTAELADCVEVDVPPLEVDGEAMLAIEDQLRRYGMSPTPPTLIAKREMDALQQRQDAALILANRLLRGR